MEHIRFSIDINAPREKVWKILWDDQFYKDWTSVFAEGSTAVTDWQEGSKVLFLDGKGSGMVSKIAKRTENEFMSFLHLGTVQEGKEDLDTASSQGWSGATENYTLRGNNGNTTLEVDMDITSGYKDYFTKTWPQALDKIKSIAEK
mgnify:CR=1 FL=1